MSHKPRSIPLRVTGLLLLLLFFTGQSAAAAADARSDTRPSSAWVRAAGARSVSARLLPAPECGQAALPLPPVELVLAGAVPHVASAAVPRAGAPRPAHRPLPLPRGPPFPA